MSIAASAKGKFTNGWKCKSSPTIIMGRFLRGCLLKHGGGGGGVSGADRSAYSVSERNSYCYSYQLRKEEIKNGIIPKLKDFSLTELGEK